MYEIMKYIKLWFLTLNNIIVNKEVEEKLVHYMSVLVSFYISGQASIY